jgi:biotin operon repressor
MLKTKQQQVLEILAGKKYQVTYGGKVSSFRKCDNEYKELVPTVLSSGFVQVILHPGKVNVYVHNLVWLSFIGEFDEDAIIRHKDGNKANNSINNLYLDKVPEEETVEVTGRVTKDGLASIMKMMEAYPKRSAASIARELGMNAQTVNYTVNKIKSGGVFKFNAKGYQVNGHKKEICQERTSEDQR